MKGIYNLKASAARAAVIAAADLSRNAESPFNGHLTLICLIKERRFDIASQWLQSLETATAHTKLARQETLDLFELVAVLWAQRELAKETLDSDQAQLLKRLFDSLGGSRFFMLLRENPRQLFHLPLTKEPITQAQDGLKSYFAATGGEKANHDRMRSEHG